MNDFKRNSTYRPQFGMERLEDRQMMAGDVTAYIQNGNLFINEAQSYTSNAVQVSQLANGMIRVQGMANQGGGTTLVDGQAYRDFSLPLYSSQVGHLVVALGSGNDTIIVGQGPVTTKFNTISINTASSIANDANDADTVILDRVTTLGGSNFFTGAGADNVAISNTTFNSTLPGYVYFNTGYAGDSVRLFNVRTKDYVEIRTGIGNDFIDVSSSTIGDGAGVDYLNVFAGAGADTINFNTNVLGSNYINGHLNLYAYDNIAENDADILDIRSTYVSRFINASLGAGADQLSMRGVWAGDDILIAGDAGNDVVKLTEVRAADDFYAYLGEGDDRLEMEYVGADQMTLNGEGGIDSVVRWNNDYVRDLALSNWETINGVSYRKVTIATPPPVKGGGYATVGAQR